jgi:hypothetical protein
VDFPEDDRELYELVFDLQRRSINAQPLTEAHVDATIGTQLVQATKECKRRGLPDMYNSSENVYEIRWGEPHGDSVTFHKERYRSMNEAMARARQLQEAFRDVKGYP